MSYVVPHHYSGANTDPDNCRMCCLVLLGEAELVTVPNSLCSGVRSVPYISTPSHQCHLLLLYLKHDLARLKTRDNFNSLLLAPQS
jgi:hypothetical protein